MNARVQIARRASLFLGTVFLGCAGCTGGGKFICVRYPDFWQPELRRVAVIPFKSETGRPADGEYVAGLVQAALVRNGTYDMFTREQAHLQGIDSEKVLAMLNAGRYEEAQRIGRLTSAQALVVGTVNVNGYNEKQERIRSQVPVYSENSKGESVVTGYRNVERVHTTIIAAVQYVVHIVDTGSGRLVSSVPVSLTGSNRSLKFMFNQSGPAILAKLQAQAIDQIVTQLAVTKSPCRLPRNALRVATGRYDGEWEWQRKLTSDDGSFLLIVRLPEAAARNRFRVTVVPKDGREVLAEESFIWAEGAVERASSFEVASIIEKNGTGPLRAKLYSGEYPIATHDFAIVESE